MPVKDAEVVKRIRRADALKYEEFDKEYNVDTATPIKPTADGSGSYAPGFIPNSENVAASSGLQNTPFECLDMINEFFISEGKYEDLSFIDIGSGKGRIILYNLLKRAPYLQYIGVEADPAFYETSIKNLETTTINVDKNVEIFNANIVDFRASYHDCVYYFYYPFDKETFESFMQANWRTIKKTNSYFVFYFEDDYKFQRYFGKPPVYDFAEITIYKLGA